MSRDEIPRKSAREEGGTKRRKTHKKHKKSKKSKKSKKRRREEELPGHAGSRRVSGEEEEEEEEEEVVVANSRGADSSRSLDLGRVRQSQVSGAKSKNRAPAVDGTTTGGTASWNILAPKSQGRNYTVSVALPGSIIDNAQSRELRTYLVGQIARSLAIFNVDEVIVFDDRSVAAEEDSGKRRPYGNPCHFMARVLQYLETPQVSGFKDRTRIHLTTRISSHAMRWVRKKKAEFIF